VKAAVFYETGPPEVLRYEDVPDPVCGPDDVLVDIEAISIEGGDTLHRARDFGLDHGISYRTSDFVAKARELTDGRNVDLVVDSVGSTLAGSIAALAYRGRCTRASRAGGGSRRVTAGPAARSATSSRGGSCSPSGLSLLGAPIFASYVLNYTFAFLFGIAFQYFAIAAMQKVRFGELARRTLQADALSLTAFELALFAWMVLTWFVVFTSPAPVSRRIGVLVHDADRDGAGVLHLVPRERLGDPARRHEAM